MALSDKDRIFNNLYGDKKVTLQNAMSLGDFKDLRSILLRGKESIIEEVKKSELKGRGGAGFPTGLKWSFISKDPNKPTYLVINADEGEPGTCKDRELIRHEPYKIIEGIIIASYALNVKTCYIYVRGEFYEEANELQRAIDECYKEGFLGNNCLSMYDLDIHIHLGSGAYICGEETALLESIEGRRPQPRIKPPFPAISGLYGCPTIINNVETIASIGAILKRGANWFTSMGIKGSSGTKLFCISGHVNNPCVIEESMGVSFKELIEYYAKGVIGGWDKFLGIIPGGISSPIIPKFYCERLTMDYEGLKVAGSSLGTGAIIVLNNSVNILDILHNIAHFYKAESCGQCSPCREGTSLSLKIINKIRNKTATKEDLSLLDNILNNGFGTSICALNDASIMAIKGFLKHYKKEIISTLG